MYEYFAHSKGNDIMLTMGSDFHFENANAWFKNLNKLIKYVNADGRVNVFYSSALDYTRAKTKSMKESLIKKTNTKVDTSNNVLRGQVYGDVKKDPALTQLAWSVKTDDFFPYSDCPHCMWTGYFTSRANLKRLVRVTDGHLQAAKQLYVFQNDFKETPALDMYREEVAIAQHHDAATGTSRQHVAYDYAKRLHAGLAATSNELHSFLAKTVDNKKVGAPEFLNCPLLNMTVCPIAAKGDVAIPIYNPSSETRTQLVRIPVDDDKVDCYAADETGTQVEPLPCEVFFAFSRNDLHPEASRYYVAAPVKVKPMSYRTIFITRGKESKFVSPYFVTVGSPGDDIVISNENYNITFSRQTGKAIKVSYPGGTQPMPLDNTFGWYESYVRPRDTNEQNSGAYIFRPINNFIKEPWIRQLAVYKGKVVQEVRQMYGESWLSMATRLSKQVTDVQFEYLVGPVDISDGIGKEVVSRWSTNMNTDEKLYTDSNGRQFLERKLNYRPTWPLQVYEPVAGNYYPVSVAAYLKDEKKQTLLSVATDRNQGAASLANGQIEFMIHRRTLADDARGVDEPLNETLAITGWPDWKRIGEGISVVGSHYMTISDPNTPASLRGMLAVRDSMDTTFNQFILSFSPLKKGGLVGVQEYAQKYLTSITYQNPIDTKLEVITLEPWLDKWTLLRVAHRFAVGEDPVYSQEAQVDISTLFPGYTLSEIVETSLTGTRRKAEDDLVRSTTRLPTIESDGTIKETGFTADLSSPVSLDTASTIDPMLKLRQARQGAAHNGKGQESMIVVKPMQVRTFWVRLVKK